MVCYAATVAQLVSGPRTPARMRIPTYAVWDTAIFALNILAFIFIGLRIRRVFRRAWSLWRRLLKPILHRRRRRPGHGHRRATGLAHVLQRRHPLAPPSASGSIHHGRCCGRP